MKLNEEKTIVLKYVQTQTQKSVFSLEQCKLPQQKQWPKKKRRKEKTMIKKFQFSLMYKNEILLTCTHLQNYTLCAPAGQNKTKTRHLHKLM